MEFSCAIVEFKFHLMDPSASTWLQTGSGKALLTVHTEESWRCLGNSGLGLWVEGLGGCLAFGGQEVCRWGGFRPVAPDPSLRL